MVSWRRGEYNQHGAYALQVMASTICLANMLDKDGAITYMTHDSIRIFTLAAMVERSGLGPEFFAKSLRY